MANTIPHHIQFIWVWHHGRVMPHPHLNVMVEVDVRSYKERRLKTSTRPRTSWMEGLVDTGAQMVVLGVNQARMLLVEMLPGQMKISTVQQHH